MKKILFICVISLSLQYSYVFSQDNKKTKPDIENVQKDSIDTKNTSNNNSTYSSKKTTTTKTSSVKKSTGSTTCGARTKSGGYCKRKVAGGGRCWQHK